jgi:hypothetical protein
MSNGGYLRLNYFIFNSEIPPLEFDALGFVGTFLESPFWCFERMLYWTVHEKLYDDDDDEFAYEIWKLKKEIYSNENLNKACNYLKSLHPVLNRGWSRWGVSLSNTMTLSGFSFVKAGRIGFDGIRHSGVSDLQSAELLQNIDILTKSYIQSIHKTNNLIEL